MPKIAILYICTGRYDVFWKDFFISCEKHLLPKMEKEVHYFVFTDSVSLYAKDSERVHVVYQEQLPWPLTTLKRFDIFQKARAQLLLMDYIYFFNANMLFQKDVGEEIIPDGTHDLVFVLHPGFYNKDRINFTYEQNTESLAYIPSDSGEHYFMGGLNGGKASAYIEMIDDLKQRISKDEEQYIVAIWHDESHLNRYAVDFPEKIKILSPAYGFAEGRKLPFDPLIMIRDKQKYARVDYLRGNTNKISVFERISNVFRRFR